MGGGAMYTQVSAGVSHTVLLRSDGRAMQCGYIWGGLETPMLIWRMRYTQVSAGRGFSALLRSDGSAVMTGMPVGLHAQRWLLNNLQFRFNGHNRTFAFAPERHT